jgi:hypothetical protein
MFSGFESGPDLIEMERGRCTDIDYIDLLALTDFIETLGKSLDSVFLSDRGGAFAIHIAKDFYIKEVRKLVISVDMFDADTCADDRDSERAAH